MSAIARLREGGYSFNCAVWNFLVVESIPTWKVSVIGVGLWHVLCLRYKCLRIMCLSIRDV